MGRQEMRVLHILTPRSNRTPALLVDEQVATIGDLVADLRRFPSAVYEIGTDRTCLDITGSLLATPDYWTVARDWLVHFTEQTGLQDILAVEGYGFWWTLNGQRFVAGLTELGNSFSWIDLLDAIHEQFGLNSILIHGQHDAIVHLAGQVCQGVKVRVSSETTVYTGRKARIPRTMVLLMVRAFLGIIYLVYAILRRPDICFFSNTNLLRETVSGSKRRLHDVYLGDVAQVLRTRGWRVTLVEKYGWHASWRGLLARGFFFPSDIIFLLVSPALYALGLHRRVVRKWRKRWGAVSPSLSQHSHYRGYNIYPLILPLVAKEFTHRAPSLEIMIGIWRWILNLWHPKLLYINNSYGLSAMTAIVAAKLLGIPTIEQQHGVIGRNHIAYLVPRHLELESRFPLCDTMVVWGEYTKRFLVDAGVYDPEQITVCGFPRTDLLLRKLPSKSETCARLSIPPDASIMLYTSNGFAQDYLLEILDSIQRVPASSRIHWLVKLHPREKTRHLWEAAIDERNLPTVQVLEGSFDFYALLAACDVHVSFASTTLIESAILGRPNLGLDVARVSDPAGYADANAFLPVAPAELGGTVSDILADSEHQKHLLEVQKGFADDWCVHDGQAVDRIVALIESVAAQSDREGFVHHATF